ncbi:MAG: peptidase domain-containing ABC transporter [Candidatus Methylumidiphilus sp.]
MDNDFPQLRQPAQRALWGLLLDEFGLVASREAVWRRVALAGEGADWAVLGAALGLRIVRARLTAGQAVQACGEQVALVAELPAGGGLVLRGFRKGLVRIAVVSAGVVVERLVGVGDIAALLEVAADAPVDWLLVQSAAPLAGAVSHDHHHHLPPLRRLLALMRPERADVWRVLGLAAGSSLLALAPPVAVQALVNTVAMGGMGQPLAVLAVILFLFLAFSGAVYVLESYLVELVQRRVFVRLAADLAERLPQVRAEVYDSQNGAELVNRFFDVLTVQKAGASLLLDGVSLAMQAVVGLALLAFYHPFLLAFDIVLLLAIALILLALGQGGVDTAIEESKAKYALVAWLEVVARHLFTFKSAGGPGFAAERTDRLAHAYLVAKRRHYRVLLRQTIGSLALYAIASTALLAIGGYLVIDGQLTLGQLVAAELIVSSVLASLVKFGKQLEGFYDLMAGVDKIGHLLDLPLERQTGAAPQAAGAAGLAVRALSFGYGGKRPVLRGVSFSVQPGERVAVFSGHGSGKSSLAQLLCGLRPAGGGQIELDGVELGLWRLDALRTRVALVGHMEIVEDSMLENVRLGRPGISVGAVCQVLAAVGLLDELALLPEALADMELGPGGAPLSHEQCLRLLLARAMVGRPGLLVLDGVLDEMDAAARTRVAPALFAADAPWTLLVLTRSPQVAALCGRVVELGGQGHD